MTHFLSHMRRWHVLATLVAVLAVTIGSTGLVTANLTGSTFDAADGNLVVDGSETDWATPAPNLKTGIDTPTGQQDDSFGEGTSENDAVPSVGTGGIPNNKSDLTRFYVANEKVSGKDFLYLAWERVQEPTGTTNMDFEFNQSSTLSSNGVTPVRTAGDLLIKYDLSQGGTTPTLGYHLWKTTANQTGANPGCEAGNKLPCWDSVHALSGANFEGAVNTASVTDPIPPDAPRTLSARTFGEASVNLTDSGIFPAGQCVNFGRAYLKSRSSDAFTSAIKDFVAPASVSVSNCGGIKITKQTLPDGDTTTEFGFTTNIGSTTTFNLKDGGVKDFGTEVTPGSYSVTENDPSTLGYDLKDIVCTVDGAGTSATTDATNPRKVNITLGVNGTVDCTFTNTKQTKLTVNKVLVPSSDPGKFNLQIDGVDKVTNVGDAGTTGKVPVTAGTHTVGETAGTGTSLSDYTTVIGGDCSAAGSVTLAAGDDKTCTITNTLQSFKVITIVCKTDNTIYKSRVDYDAVGGTDDTDTIASAPANSTAASICGITDGIHAPVPRGSHTATITIP